MQLEPRWLPDGRCARYWLWPRRRGEPPTLGATTASSVRVPIRVSYDGRAIDHATHPDTGDRLYFRQLLAGRDFATEDQLARQMVNFVYLIGDRETGDAVVVDPAYDVDGILDVLADDDMRCTGALALSLIHI